MKHRIHVWTRAPCRNNQLRGVWRGASQLSCVSAAVVRLQSCAGQPAHDRRSCREVRVKIGNCVSSVQQPRPRPRTTIPGSDSYFSHPSGHTSWRQEGWRMEDGGTLIWFLPRFEFKLERGGGWRSPHSMARCVEVHRILSFT